MNLRARFQIRPLLLSWAAGAVFVLILFGLTESGAASDFAQALLSPGLLVAGWAGYGSHDIETIFLAILGDSLFYGLLTFIALSLVRAKRDGPIR